MRLTEGAFPFPCSPMQEVCSLYCELSQAVLKGDMGDPAEGKP